LVALEAISAGIPVLVTVESGIAKALEKVEGGKSVIVESDDAEDWAHRILELSKKNPEERHDSAIHLRENYKKAYPWSSQCERFKERIVVLMEGSCRADCANGTNEEGASSSKKESLCISGTVPELEPSHTGEQQSDPGLPEVFYQPHLTNQPQPSEERNVSRTNEEGTVMTLSTRNVKRPGKRTHSQSTLGQGTSEESASSSKKKLSRISGTIAEQDAFLGVSDERVQETVVEVTGRVGSHEAEAADPWCDDLSRYDSFPLEQFPWYFGKLTKRNAEKLLQSHDLGTFLVRDSESVDKRGSYVISVRDRNGYRHQEIETLPNGKLVLKEDKNESFSGLPASVQYLKKCLEHELRLVPLLKEEGYNVSPIREKPLIANDTDKTCTKTANNGAGNSEQSIRNDGCTLLHSAAQSGNIDTIEVILSLGCDLDSRKSDGATPLMVAAINGRPQAFRYLISKGADPSLKDNDRWSLLHYAAEGGNVEIIEKLLSLGLDLESRNNNGSTPLMIAAMNGRPEAFRFLVSKGADPSLKDNYGWSLLHYAAQGGNVEIIEKLLSFGLDINSKESDGSTPLMAAAIQGRPQAFEYLTSKGADPSLKNNEGASLLHYASKGGNVEIIEKLLSLGLDINSKESDGSTPLSVATAKGNAEAVRFLLSRGAH